MPTEILIVIGGGGHASVVIDAWLQAGGTAVGVRVFDDNLALQGRELDAGIRITAPIAWDEVAGRDCHVAVGGNAVRMQLLQRVRDRGGRPKTVVHPRAVVAASARIAPGCFVAAGAIAAPRSDVGAGSIVNHGAVVDHDCVVGSGSHVAPNSALGGGVRLGERVLVGAGATVLPGVAIASDAVIGAGGVVTRDVEPGRVMIGIPAKKR